MSSLAIAPGQAFAQDADGQEVDGQEAASASQGEDPVAAPAATQAQEGQVTDLKSVIVTGQIQYRDRAETTAPQLVYGREFFQKFEPVSVGDQLRRVPGVAFTSDIGESDAPQLRGLGLGYTQVLVNGRPIPGAGNDRTVFVDRIPAEIIDRIEIVRAPSADIDSQGVGGTINIILKDGESLPPGVIARIGVSHDQASGKNRPNASVSWSGRNQSETAFWSLTLDAQKRFNEKHAVEEVFEEDSVGFAEEVAAHGTGRRLERWDDASQSSAVERTEQSDWRDSEDKSFNGDATFLLSEETSLRFDAFYLTTDRREHEDTREFEGDGSVGGLDLEDPAIELQDAHFQQKSHGLAALLTSKAGGGTWKAELSYNRFDDDGIEDTFEDEPGNLVNREVNDAEDGEWLAGLSYARDFGDRVSGKFGISAKRKDRDYRLVVSDDMDDEEDITINDGQFDYQERRLDAYGVLKWKLSDNVTLETGLRAESTKTEQSFATAFYEAGTLEETSEGSASSDEFQLNPSAHLRWSINDSDQLRFSVAKTVRRPSIDQLVPALSLESPADEDVTVGNPGLKQETSIGFDIGYEHRIGRRGVFGVNLFARSIDDLIGLVNTGEGTDSVGLDPEDFPGNVYSYANIGKAKVRGIEFDLSTPLDFIGLSETGVFANYTRLHSERDDPAGGGDIFIDYQPDYVYNVGITQNIPSWDASIGASYQKQGESDFVTYGEIEHQLYDGNLEVFIEKRLGDHTMLRLTGSNLLDARSIQTESGFDGDNGAEIIGNQAAYNVDGFEVERERSSPRWTLTLRMVF
ncbi:TonB-dependent receptor plug domain-containing protein [Pseudoxanthomonas sangjuensis]|uniref:TonB-dependent receptor plug domain-containing protein n=1 Tax=Pseudoxanthomonas sangjuensis TaxID=1503750 RepID=UPI00139168E6|nr:TonB-dependent receptor [Pseudoxanthomonas sangjuensis]